MRVALGLLVFFEVTLFFLPLSTAFSRVGALTLASGENILRSAVIDPEHGFAYFGTYAPASTNFVVKVRLSDFSRVGNLSLNPGETGCCSAIIDSGGQYAYFSGGASLVKIRLSNFSEVASLYLLGQSSYSAVIDDAHNFAYLGMGTGDVFRIRLSDFSIQGSLILSDRTISSAAIDTFGGYAYFGTDSYPGTVVKIRLSDFTIDGNLTLNLGENQLRSAVIDQSAGYAYFGSCTSSGGRVLVKVRLSNLTRMGAVPLNSGFCSSIPSVIDESGGYAYVGIDTYPGMVVKVRLSNFTIATTTMLSSGEDGLSSAVIDTAHGYSYFGTWTNPGIVVKIQTETVPSAPGLLTAKGGLGTVTLDWTAPANGGYPVTGYRVYRGNVSGSESFLHELNNLSYFVDNSVTSGFTYYYKVTALNALGEGGFSNEASSSPSSSLDIFQPFFVIIIPLLIFAVSIKRFFREAKVNSGRLHLDRASIKFSLSSRVGSL